MDRKSDASKPESRLSYSPDERVKVKTNADTSGE
jgi:hypothetical protein